MSFGVRVKFEFKLGAGGFSGAVGSGGKNREVVTLGVEDDVETVEDVEAGLPMVRSIPFLDPPL